MYETYLFLPVHHAVQYQSLSPKNNLSLLLLLKFENINLKGVQVQKNGKGFDAQHLNP